jgi:hypothetical protein
MPIIQQKRGTSRRWSELNPILLAGEIGYETDTGNFKIGDGTTEWYYLTPWNTSFYYSPRATVPLVSQTAAQSPLGLTNGVSLVAGNTYTVEFYLQGGCGTTSGQLQYASSGTATYTSLITVNAARPASSATLVSPETRFIATGGGGTVFNVTSAGTGATWVMSGVGQINVTVSGTWNPQIAFSVAPGTTVSASSGCFVRVTLANATALSTSIGTWS